MDSNSRAVPGGTMPAGIGCKSCAELLREKAKFKNDADALCLRLGAAIAERNDLSRKLAERREINHDLCMRLAERDARIAALMENRPDPKQVPAEPKPGHPGFLRAAEELVALHAKKAKDYGVGADPLRNIRASADFGIKPWIGAIMRANDKMARLKTYCEKGSLANESFEDSLIDLAAYALIALALSREDSDGKSAGQGVAVSG